MPIISMGEIRIMQTSWVFIQWVTYNFLNQTIVNAYIPLQEYAHLSDCHFQVSLPYADLKKDMPYMIYTKLNILY